MTTSSNVPQPTSCTTLSTDGIHDRTPPNRPRSSTMAGAPVAAPGIAESPTIALPITVPTTVASTAAPTVSGGAPAGRRTASTPAKPRRLTPRLAQNAPWSRNPRVLGTGPSRVGATSATGVSALVGLELGVDVVIRILPAPA